MRVTNQFIADGNRGRYSWLAGTLAMLIIIILVTGIGLANSQLRSLVGMVIIGAGIIAIGTLGFALSTITTFQREYSRRLLDFHKEVYTNLITPLESVITRLDYEKALDRQEWATMQKSVMQMQNYCRRAGIPTIVDALASTMWYFQLDAPGSSMPSAGGGIVGKLREMLLMANQCITNNYEAAAKALRDAENK